MTEKPILLEVLLAALFDSNNDFISKAKRCNQLGSQA
jgi:hypothetical protein